MKILINNKETDVETDSNVLDAVSKYFESPTGFALAVNNTVIPKQQWADTMLSENDKIVLIKAICGG